MPQNPVIKIPYIALGQGYKPYLEVIFSNTVSNATSYKTFALVDTGADHSVIPFSLGTQIGLEKPTVAEIKKLKGVSGSLTYIERPCNFHIVDNTNSKLHTFKETVWWVHPAPETVEQLTQLSNSYNETNEYQGQSKDGSKLWNYFEQQKFILAESYRSLLQNYETDVIIGRSFMDNFDFIQFVHKDRLDESKCYFNYKLKNKGKYITTTI